MAEAGMIQVTRYKLTLGTCHLYVGVKAGGFEEPRGQGFEGNR